jgi:hypothetical protein
MYFVDQYAFPEQENMLPLTPIRKYIIPTLHQLLFLKHEAGSFNLLTWILSSVALLLASTLYEA